MKYAIFGAGELGARYYEILKDEYNIICFIDSDKKKQGTKYMALDVVRPEDAAGMDLNIIIAASFKYQLEIMGRLHKNGVRKYYLPEGVEDVKLKCIDFSRYDDISEQKNKICVYRVSHAGTGANTFVQNNCFDDVCVVSANPEKRDSEFYYQYMTSGLIITQTGGEIEGNKKSIEIWHGFTIKTIGYMYSGSLESQGTDVYESFNSKNAVCSLSKLYSIFMVSCTKVDYSKFCITGYPRNDMIFSSDGRAVLEKMLGDIKQKHVVFYAPTYRYADNQLHKNGKDEYISDLPDYNNARLDEFLKKNDILFIYKTHSMQKDKGVVEETDNIKRITDEMLFEKNVDLYEILNGTDCLISDYSSIIIDYLLTDKPMIFTPADLEEYSKTRGLMLEPYDAWMPGDIALDYKQLENAITDALFGEDRYKKDRERLRRITHKYADGNSTVRVLELARKILGIASS